MCILSRRLLSTSLPVSLMTDCGGLLNRRGPGRKRCCRTGLFTRDIMFTLHTDGSCPELSNYRIFLHTEHHGRSRGFVTNYRNSFFTRRVTESLGIYVTNYRISFHTENHGVFLCHETCSWSRICELSNFFLYTDGRGGYEGGTIEA